MLSCVIKLSSNKQTCDIHHKLNNAVRLVGLPYGNSHRASQYILDSPVRLYTSSFPAEFQCAVGRPDGFGCWMAAELELACPPRKTDCECHVPERNPAVSCHWWPSGAMGPFSFSTLPSALSLGRAPPLAPWNGRLGDALGRLTPDTTRACRTIVTFTQDFVVYVHSLMKSIHDGLYDPRDQGLY